MNREQIIKIDSRNIKISLSKCLIQSDVVVLFLPGISGGALTDKFNSLVEACLDKNIDILKIESWKNVEELEQKNIADIHSDIVAAIDYVKNIGYKSIVAIGKSFGGAMLLSLNHPEISKLVLWAPAIGTNENEGNLKNYLTVKFSEITSPLDLTMDRRMLSEIKIPVRIIHGTTDKNVPLDNSKNMASILLRADLITIQDMGHSYETRAQEKEVIENTLSFL